MSGKRTILLLLLAILVSLAGCVMYPAYYPYDTGYYYAPYYPSYYYGPYLSVPYGVDFYGSFGGHHGYGGPYRSGRRW